LNKKKHKKGKKSHFCTKIKKILVSKRKGQNKTFCRPKKRKGGEKEKKKCNNRPKSKLSQLVGDLHVVITTDGSIKIADRASVNVDLDGSVLMLRKVDSNWMMTILNGAVSSLIKSKKKDDEICLDGDCYAIDTILLNSGSSLTIENRRIFSKKLRLDLYGNASLRLPALSLNDVQIKMNGKSSLYTHNTSCETFTIWASGNCTCTGFIVLNKASGWVQGNALLDVLVHSTCSVEIDSFEYGRVNMTRGIETIHTLRKGKRLKTTPVIPSGTDVKASNGDPTCQICLENKAVVSTATCHHLCLCFGCCLAMFKKNGPKWTCPMCRANNTEIVKIFY